MASEPDYPYDVFISYNQANEDWVLDWLVPQLQEAGLRVATLEDIQLFALPKTTNIERAIDSARHTIVILTPDWLNDEWNEFEAILLVNQDPAARRRKLVPILLKPCDPPPAIKFRTPADFTVEHRWKKTCKALANQLIDLQPAPFPLRQPGQERDRRLWQRWLYHYRYWLWFDSSIGLVCWVVLFTFLELPPFRPLPVWQAELLEASRPTSVHNSGTSLIIGAENIELGCWQPHLGLWYRPLSPRSQWQNSRVKAELLCIKDWQGTGQDALSNIVALASRPEEPETIYALTSHSGLLVSHDDGASFQSHPATDSHLIELIAKPGLAMSLFVVTGQNTPIFWVANAQHGLMVYEDEDWRHLDGSQPAGCQGLPELTVLSLLITDRVMLIGSSQQGLWLSTNGGKTCQPVFDVGLYPRYAFYGLWDISVSAQSRYLALVLDGAVEPGGNLGTWQLLLLCPFSDSCDETTWQAETMPLWHQTIVVEDVLVQPDGRGDFEWYLVTEFGQVWWGAVAGGISEPLPGIHRCYVSLCHSFIHLAPVGPGQPPYLLVNNRFYHYSQGAWWQRLWP